MQVSMSDAAKMVGINRSTLYMHIKEKSITVIDSETKRPKIDVSELIRVYGDKLRPLEEIGKKDTDHKNDNSQQNLGTEIALLRERLKTAELERDRERSQLSEQIENLQELLKKEQETVGKITALLTDQRSSTEKNFDRDVAHSKKIEELEALVRSVIETQGLSKESDTTDNEKKQPWWLFSLKKKTT